MRDVPHREHGSTGNEPEYVEVQALGDDADEPDEVVFVVRPGGALTATLLRATEPG